MSRDKIRQPDAQGDDAAIVAVANGSRRNAFLRVRLIVVLALVALVQCALPSSAQQSVTMPTVVELIRTTNGPSHLQVAFTNGSDGSISAAVGLWTLTAAGTPSGTGLIVTPGGHLAPQSNQTGPATGCVVLPVRPPTLCESRVAGVAVVDLSLDTTSARETSKIVLAFVGDKRSFSAKLDSSTTGWRMLSLVRRVQVQRTQDLGGAYAISASEGVEHFTGATLPGGTFGSLTIAALPCRELSDGQSTGRGNATLTGGASPVPLGCPDGPSLAGAGSRRQTSWKFQGDVYGTTAAGIQVTNKAMEVSSSPEDVRLLTVDGPF